MAMAPLGGPQLSPCPTPTMQGHNQSLGPKPWSDGKYSERLRSQTHKRPHEHFNSIRNNLCPELDNRKCVCLTTLFSALPKLKCETKNNQIQWNKHMKYDSNFQWEKALREVVV